MQDEKSMIRLSHNNFSNRFIRLHPIFHVFLSLISETDPKIPPPPGHSLGMKS
jgi:hypothetical protein